jgi:hypothetical protein
MSPRRPCPTPGVGVQMVSSTAWAMLPTWRRVAVIVRERSHRDRHAPMRAGSTPAAGRLVSCCGQTRLLLRAGSTPAGGEREDAGSVFRLAVIGGQTEADSWASGP